MMEKPRVLVVDDEIGIQEFFRDFISDHAYEVTISSSADEALRMMATDPPDIVVADLPKVDLQAKIADLAQKFNTLLICASQFSLIPDDFDVPSIARILNKPFRAFDLKIAVRSELAKR